MRHILLLFALTLSILFSGCESRKEEPVVLPMGTWRGVMTQQGQQLPFIFKLTETDTGKLQMVLHNDTERILIDEVTRKEDSLLVTFNFYDTGLKLKIGDKRLSGVYDKRYAEGHLLGFEAIYGEEKRFKNTNQRTQNIAGRYSVVFTESDGKQYPAVAVLEQEGSKVNGTFLTETGDYRFLEGIADGDSLKLSAFDGTHLFLFTAKISGDSLQNGQFWHGKDTYERWTGIKNPDAQLTDQYDLTYLKEGYDKITFTFPDLSGDSISLDDPVYRDKVVILQILGTWCPNCMDETKFYTEWYGNNSDRPVEIIGLAYENKPDFNYASQRVKKMKDKMGVPYTMLIAGTSDKEAASATLPMLNAIISFPTSVFIDKTGKVRKIHTGFSGPGTGVEYEKWKTSFNELMEKLLSE
ncbi:MAG: TlpA disulfide reductase family protein [Cyclobacteriaceae bacterium]